MAILPTTGINSTIVKEALGAGSHKWSVLCKHANINKWSKWKPIRSNKDDEITASDLASANYGLNIIQYGSVASVVSAYGINGGIWAYLTPRGGAVGEPYRIGDFRNYDHSAPPFVGSATVTKMVNKNGANPVVGASIIAAEPTVTQIGWDNIITGDRRLYAALMSGSTVIATEIGALASTKTLSMNISALSAGNYKMWLMLANTGLTQFYTIDGVSATGYDVAITNYDVQVNISGYFQEAEFGWEVRYTVSIYNTRNVSVSLTNCATKLRDASKAYADTLVTGEKSWTLGNISVAPNSIHTEELVFVNVNPNLFTGWKLWWHNEGVYADEKWVNIAKPL